MSGLNLSFVIAGVTKTSFVRAGTVETSILHTLANKSILRCSTLDTVVPTTSGYRPATDATIIVNKVSPSVVLYDGRILDVDNMPATEPAIGVITDISAVSYELALEQRFINHTEYGSDPVPIAVVSTGNPSPVTTRENHGFTTGDKVIIQGISGSNNDAAVNATHTVTVTGLANFTIPVNITVAGGGNATVRKVTPLTTILNDFVTPYFTPYGITLNTASIVGTPLLEKQVFNKISVMEVLRHLSVVTGIPFRFLPSRTLEWFTVGQKVSAFNLIVSNVLTGVRWRKTRASQANTIIVNYGTTSVVSRDMPFVGAGGTRVFALPYTPILASSTSSPGQVWNYAESRWQHVGRYGLDTSFEFVYRDSDNTIVQLATWGGVTGWPAIADGVGYYFQADVQFPQTVTVTDTADVALNGTREMIVDFPDTFDIEAARQFGQAQLRIALVTARRLSVTTRAGLEYPGTVVTVDLPKHSLPSATWLISGTTIREEEAGLLTYTYDLIEGSTVIPSWRDDLRSLFGGGASTSGGGSVSGGGIPPDTGGLTPGDVFANKTMPTAGSLIYESSLIGQLANASHLGPALILGPIAHAQSWAISADFLATFSRRSLRFIPITENATLRFAMQLTSALIPVAGEYYLTPNTGGILHLGATTAMGGFGSGFRVTSVNTLGLDMAGGTANFLTGATQSLSLIGQGVSTGVSYYFSALPINGPHFGLASEITGGAAGTPSYKVAGYFAASTGSLGDDVIALNAVAQWNAGHTASNVVGLEINVNNNNSDLTLNQTPWVGGFLIASGGTKHPGRAILLGATSAANTWRKGLDIPASAVSDTGIEVGTPTAGLVGSVLVKQLANAGDTLLLQRNTDTAPTGALIRCVNAANSAELFKVSVNGKLDVGASGPVSIAGDVIAVFRNASATGYGVAIYGGSSTSNYALLVVDGAVANNLFEVAGDGGVKVGAPTGGTGGSMGLGKLNVAGDLYRNGTAYTNPKWVLQRHYDGVVDVVGPYAVPPWYDGLWSLDAHRMFVRASHDLPLMTKESDGGMFRRGDMMLASLEEAYLYIYELHDRITMLEDNK